MTTTNDLSVQGPSRRNVLRGAALGSAVLWTVPVVQAVTMTAASAQTASDTKNNKPKSNNGNQDDSLKDNGNKGGNSGN